MTVIQSQLEYGTGATSSFRDELDNSTRIVDAACAVLRRARYRNLKVERVARTAGVSIGTLYRAFGSKEALLAEVYRRELVRATAILTELTSSGTPVQRVMAWVDAVASLVVRHRARARWFSTLPDDVVRLATMNPVPAMDTGASLRAAIADGIADGCFPNADVLWDSHLIETMCAQLCSSHPDWSEREAEAAVQKLVEFVLASLRRGVEQ